MLLLASSTASERGSCAPHTAPPPAAGTDMAAGWRPAVPASLVAVLLRVCVLWLLARQRAAAARCRSCAPPAAGPRAAAAAAGLPAASRRSGGQGAAQRAAGQGSRPRLGPSCRRGPRLGGGPAWARGRRGAEGGRSSARAPPPLSHATHRPQRRAPPARHARGSLLPPDTLAAARSLRPRDTRERPAAPPHVPDRGRH